VERLGAGAPSGLQNRHAVVARRWVGSIPAPLRSCRFGSKARSVPGLWITGLLASGDRLGQPIRARWERSFPRLSLRPRLHPPVGRLVAALRRPRFSVVPGRSRMAADGPGSPALSGIASAGWLARGWGRIPVGTPWGRRSSAAWSSLSSWSSSARQGPGNRTYIAHQRSRRGSVKDGPTGPSAASREAASLTGSRGEAWTPRVLPSVSRYSGARSTLDRCRSRI
jgi:hypothetical protein